MSLPDATETVAAPTTAASSLAVEAVNPSAASALGEVMVTVKGAGFMESATITIGGQDATWHYLDSNTLAAYLPAHSPGPVDVVVTNPDGESAALVDGFTYRPPFFVDMAPEAGADFLHYRDAHSLLAFGAGVVVFDYNGDDNQDIYVTSTPDVLGLAETDGHNALYRNNGDGTFTDVAREAGVADLSGLGNGGCAADYDNDGHQDLFVANWGSSKLFRNNGDGAFADVTAAAGVGDPDPTYRTMGCAWGDYDRDGFLDLAVVRHVDESDAEAVRLRAFADLVRPLALYRNQGDGTFAGVTGMLGDTTFGKRREGKTFGNLWGAGFQPGWADLDNDNDPDLYVVNDFGEFTQPNVLWRNDGPDPDGGWKFTDVSGSSGADVAIYGMGLAVGDYNLDGSLDLFMTNMGDNVLLTNNGGGLTFTDATGKAGVGVGEFRDQMRVSWGTVFFDYDNDGDEDLYVVSGFLDDDPFHNRPEQPNVLLRNNGDGTFTDVSAVSGAADWGIGRGVAYADFNQDGCLDLYVTNLGVSSTRGQRARLFQNKCDWGNNWLVVKLTGTASNRDAVGARVTLVAGGRTQIREVMAGSSNKSQNMLPVHFGVGQATGIDSVTVRWPSGQVQTLTDVPANQRLNLVEPP